MFAKLSLFWDTKSNVVMISRLSIFTAHSELQKVGRVTRDKQGHFSALSAGCVRFMFGKTSLVSSFLLCL